MKELFIAAVARSALVQAEQGSGMRIMGFMIGLVVSALGAVVIGLLLILTFFIFIGVFASFGTGSLFEGLRIAWDNSPTYGVVGGVIFGVGFFLMSFVFPIMFKEQVEEKRASHERLKESLGFEGADEFSGDNFIIMADEGLTKALVLWSKKFAAIPDYTILTAENIIESAVYIDDMTVSQVKSGTASSLTGAAVGGVLTGGVGAVVGAIAGKRSKSESEVRVHRIGINLTLKDTARPHAELIFHKPSSPEDKGLKKGDMVFNHLVENANRWQAVIKNIIANAEEV